MDCFKQTREYEWTRTMWLESLCMKDVGSYGPQESHEQTLLPLLMRKKMNVSSWYKDTTSRSIWCQQRGNRSPGLTVRVKSQQVVHKAEPSSVMVWIGIEMFWTSLSRRYIYIYLVIRTNKDEENYSGKGPIYKETVWDNRKYCSIRSTKRSSEVFKAGTKDR